MSSPVCFGISFDCVILMCITVFSYYAFISSFVWCHIKRQLKMRSSYNSFSVRYIDSICIEYVKLRKYNLLIIHEWSQIIHYWCRMQISSGFRNTMAHVVHDKHMAQLWIKYACTIVYYLHTRCRLSSTDAEDFT